MIASQNDFLILESIMDENDKTKGVLPINGTTKEELVSKTTLSKNKITITLHKLIEAGFVKYGLTAGHSKTYIITEIGKEEYEKLKTPSQESAKYLELLKKTIKW